MRSAILAAFVVLASQLPAFGASVQASMLPDGMYAVTVRAVKSGVVMTVKMENSLEVDVRAAAHTSVNFNGLNKDQHVKLMIVEGQVVGVVPAK